MTKIRYEKEHTGKLIGRGGPRDIQNRQRLMQQEQKVRELVEAEVGTHPRMVSNEKIVQPSPQVDLSQYIPFDEVRKKLEEAVEYTRKEEKARYDSGLRNLNDQLNEARKKLNAAQEELINKNADITRLREQSMKDSTGADSIRAAISKKDEEINNRDQIISQQYARISILESKIVELSNQTSDSANEVYIQAMEAMQEKLDQLYSKISDGSIESLVGSKLDRPSLEDKIFIDPLRPEDVGELDSHIDVKEEVVNDSENRDITSDVAKLRKLLKL